MRKLFLAAIALAIPFSISAARAQPAEQDVVQPQASPPPEDFNKRYPLCSATIQDECVNPRQAGMHYGNRPLAYWPGEPASEMQGTGYGHRASRHIAKRHHS